jgi:site-specific recombinase XerD
MAQTTQPISPLRQRMIEDMRLRKLAPRTQASYICSVKKLADYLGHSPHTATAEDLRRFQLHLTDTGTSRITINTTITALRFRPSGLVRRLPAEPVPLCLCIAAGAGI